MSQHIEISFRTSLQKSTIVWCLYHLSAQSSGLKTKQGNVGIKWNTHTHTADTMLALCHRHACYHIQYTHTHTNTVHTNPLEKQRHTHILTHKDTRTHTCRVLLLLPDKSLSIDQCLCTSGGAERERNWEEWTHVVNLFQLKTQPTPTPNLP